MFEGSWLLAAPPARVAAVLVDLADYPTWWPEVRAVASLGPDDAQALCRSRLPYTLDLRLHAESRTAPELRVSVDGDLRGEVAWWVEEGRHGDTRLRLDQEVEVTGRLLPALAAVGGPVLRWNHDAMMRSGVAGLRRRLREPDEAPAG